MISLGTDIIEVERIRSNITKYGDIFLDKILTPEEKEYCLKYKDPSPHVAARFAAKEAVAKALSTGFGEHLNFHDIEVIKAPSGKPQVRLSQTASLYFNNPLFEISLSHCKSHAVATVILTY